ncbi:helix-turn-helix domain-containing protein [Empedobacter falsenii]|uniref:helix-turn-helix domain-containing protein n=1 Tax=Empedobacter falsenii TaxID=343874 RepID=UPI0025791D55|nr:helix-turn-helix domain-containing protein [Empedobacter falsenii]MDM1548176.1 helix-turn-helix domain-containing protein [Empedobacter falsenii]
MINTLTLYNVDAEDLVNQIKTIVEKTINQQKEILTMEVEFLTREETAKILKIDLSTLHRWTCKGVISQYGMGNKRYYLRSEIEQKMISNKLN